MWLRKVFATGGGSLTIIRELTVKRGHTATIETIGRPAFAPDELHTLALELIEVAAGMNGQEVQTDKIDG